MFMTMPRIKLSIDQTPYRGHNQTQVRVRDGCAVRHPPGHEQRIQLLIAKAEKKEKLTP